MSQPSILLSAVPEAGGYLSLVKILVMFALLLPWLWVSAWADKDTLQVHLPRSLWSPLMLGSGLVGLLIWLLLPFYLAGLGIYLVLVATVGGVYIVQRNNKVVPEARVLTGDHLATLFERKQKSTGKIVVRLKLYNNTGKPVPPPAEGTADQKLTFNQTQDLLYEAMSRRASGVDVAPAAGVSTIKFLIDGVLTEGPSIPRAEAETMIDYLKSVSGMDTADKRRPQQGRISVDLAGHPLDINVVVAGSTSGQRVQMKMVQEAIRTRIEELGLSQDTLARLRQLNSQPTGLIIVAARPGNGCTSTLYSLLRDNDAYIKQLLTVEEKPEVEMENIRQQPYKGAADMPKVLASVIRRDPDVVMVDQCTDAPGAEVILEAASEKKILLGMKASDTFTALARWAKVVGDARQAVLPLKAVLCQVLMRKLCPACRESYTPDPDMIRKANLPADRIGKFFRPPSQPLTDEKGNPVICPTCQGSGYFGRTAAFELLEMTDEIRKLITEGANLTQIKATARKKKMLYLQEQALRQVIDGVTSIQEVIRVTRTKEQG